jgi:hypothetical protein
MQRLVLATLASFSSSLAPQEVPQTLPRAQEVEVTCPIDLTRVGQMEDVLSNALMHAYRLEGQRVRSYLTAARKGCADGPELLRKTATEFDLDVGHLDAAVSRFRHVNCTHPHEPIAELVALDAAEAVAKSAASTAGGAAVPPTMFATDVTLHVVLHELAHALVREFDLPILGNEETLADAFATHYLVTELPERAPAVLRARVASLLHESAEVPRAEWTVGGEHNSDARRAHQIAALALAADRERYAHLADLVGMTADQRGDAADYGAEIHRSWRRVLRPLWMPHGQASKESRVVVEDGVPSSTEFARDLLPVLEGALGRFDWHSQVTLAFAMGEGSAGWSRSKRTITVKSGYVQRVVRQGEARERGGK